MTTSTNTRSTFVDLPQLIVAVKKRPGLYDTSTPGYHDRILKKSLWEEVCRELCDTWDEMTDDERCKIGKYVQWTLKATYYREYT